MWYNGTGTFQLDTSSLMRRDFTSLNHYRIKALMLIN